MSYIVIAKIPGNLDVFTKALSERTAEFEAWSAKGRSVGGIHHRFAVAEGQVIAIDEWETMEAFQQFFADPEFNAFIESVGADPSTPPEVWVGESIASPDQY